MDLKISSPCPMRWENLTGDNRIRYRGQCRLNVYNLAEMGVDEIESLFRTAKGRVCGRIYLRGDRTATLRDCPQGRAGKIRRRFLQAFAAIGVVVFALTCRSFPGPDLSGLPQWAQAIFRWMEPEPLHRTGTTMGMVCPPRAPAGIPPTSTPTVGP